MRVAIYKYRGGKINLPLPAEVEDAISTYLRTADVLAVAHDFEESGKCDMTFFYYADKEIKGRRVLVATKDVTQIRNYEEINEELEQYGFVPTLVDSDGLKVIRVTKKIAQMFLDFLIDNKAAEKYIHNINAQREMGVTLIEFVEIITAANYPANKLVDLFHWSSTDEDVEYWWYLHKNWTELLQNHEEH